nr:granulocyte-macrophage colony-stimulating factor receptor subunit alpha isoform X3 [Loxodonta africana]
MTLGDTIQSIPRAASCLSTQEPVPRLHVTFDPREMTLAWDCRENATVVKCLMSHREEGQISMKPIDKQCSCTFELRSLHRGVVLTVEANTSQGLFEQELLYDNPDMYSPPTNITTNCNHSHCLLEWQRPRAQQNVPASELMYEVDIRQKGSKDGSSNKLISIPGNSGNKHNFPINPRASYTVQIRTANSRILHWGPWSEPVKFGFEEQESSPTYVYVLVVLGTLLGALVIGFLFKRFLLTHNLFPPIPKIKDKLNDNQQTNLQVSWDQLTSDAGKAENEDVLTVVEEVV